MEFSDNERNRHIYILGKTGSGKSTIMKRLALDDIERGECVIFIDPHGPDVLDILDHIPRRRIGDVCYLNLADPEHAVGFRATARPQHTRSGLKDIWADSWGARLDWYLINLLYILEANPELTIANLPRLLYDEPYRLVALGNVANPVVQDFWQREYHSYPDRYNQEAQGPILNKVGQFLEVPEIFASITQRHPKLDLDVAIDKRQIILLNLNKGALGDEPASIYGSLFISALKTVVMAGPPRRVNFFCDEFQSFGSSVFAPLLSETRKYGLHITLAHQFMQQLPPDVRYAIIGNVGTIIAFSVGAFDAELIAAEFAKETSAFNAAMLTTLPPFEAYIKRHGQPPTLTTTAPLPPARSHRDTIIAQSNMRFARRRTHLIG
jgi:hypothetical protein